MRLKVTVEDEHTGTAIDGATVTTYVTDAGPSDKEVDVPVEDADTGTDGVARAETESVDSHSGTAVFEVAKWVTELTIEASHERFSTSRYAFHPSVDKDLVMTLTPDRQDVTIGISEHFPENTSVRLSPADPVVEDLYGTEIQTDIPPGTTESFSFIVGRYNFTLEDPPENYTGKTNIAKNLELEDSPRVEFSGMEPESEEKSTETTESTDVDNPSDIDGSDPDNDSKSRAKRVQESITGLFSGNESTEPEIDDPAPDVELTSGPSDEGDSDDSSEASTSEGGDEDRGEEASEPLQDPGVGVEEDGIEDTPENEDAAEDKDETAVGIASGPEEE